MNGEGDGWRKRAFGALGLILAVAIAARVVWALLEPLVPGLVALVVLGVVYAITFGKSRQ
jgi:hypothetical protein